MLSVKESLPIKSITKAYFSRGVTMVMEDFSPYIPRPLQDTAKLISNSSGFQIVHRRDMF
jgi:hypothetical protein